MRRLGGFLVIGVLLLSGCATSKDDAEPSAPASASASASASATAPEPEAVGSYTEISTLSDGIAYGRSLSADTPDLAAEMSGTARALGDLVVKADLPFDVHNAVGQSLVSLNAAVLNDPSSAVAQLSELNLIMDKIETAI